VARGDSRVRLIANGSGRGPAHARNVGAREARGAVIAFCDADDVVAPGWLAALDAALAHSVAATGPQEQRALNPPWLQDIYGNAAANGLQRFAGLFPFGPSANLALRRDVFCSLNGFDPEILVGEDIELCMRIWDRGDELVFAPQAVVHYRNRSRLRDIWRQARAYGAAAPMLVARLERLGHPVPKRWHGARNWVWLLRHLPLLQTRAGRARWLVVAGIACGRVEGSFRWRCTYL
jgi:glycosyltransferase involved in cell wall biosynthesis